MENIHHELVEWADKFLKAAIWKYISDADNFCIHHISWKEPAFISILGNAGIAYGVSIWRGVRSYLLLQGLKNSDTDVDTAFTEGDVIWIDKCVSLKMNFYGLNPVMNYSKNASVNITIIIMPSGEVGT